MSLMNVVSLWWSMSLMATPVDSDRVKEFVSGCRSGTYMTCVQTGMGWLQHSTLTAAQKRTVYVELSRAYLFLGREQHAANTMEQLVRMAPCIRELPGLKGKMRTFFIKVRKNVLASNPDPPTLSHITPSRSELLEKRTLEAKVTDELMVRDVILYYRTRTEGPFEGLPLDKVEKGKDNYSVRLPKKALEGSKVFEYYLRARSCADRFASAGSAPKPLKILLESNEGSGVRSIAGSALVSLGVVLLLGGGFSFYAAVTEFENVKKLNNSPEAQTAKDRLLVYQILGFGGVILGVGAGILGTYLLLTPANAKKASVRLSFPFMPRPRRIHSRASFPLSTETFCTVH